MVTIHFSTFQLLFFVIPVMIPVMINDDSTRTFFENQINLTE